MSERRIGNRYVLERRVAGGGMGAIWVALDTQLQRRVAIKLMAPERVASASARLQFEHEAKAVAQLRNPHVVQIYDYGVDEDTPYIVMELLAGEDLEMRLQRRERLAPAAVATLLHQVARALSEAHAVGLVHGDLKPANLFLSRGDTGEVLKVLDFGLSRWVAGTPAANEQPGRVMGTPRYMSPEQRRGEAGVDLRADLWSLAVAAYQALTGRFPFSADALEALARGEAVPLEPPSRWEPSLGKGMDDFFAQALELEPTRRFQSAGEFATAFAALVAEQPTRAAKILVIDDEPDVALLMRQRFRNHIKAARYEFIFAADGVEALEKLRQHPDTDVVLSDINMPRMDGLTFLARVGEVNPLVKVIIVSAYSDMNNIRVAMNRGAFDFLVKPIEFADLDATLGKALRHVTELRQMVRSAEENELLRLFVGGGILERVLPMLRGPSVQDGERGEATVAFLNVKDFTRLVSSGESADAVLRRLNAHFEVLVPELQSRGGVVDKFVGNSVLVVFRGQHHLLRALDACLAARQQLRAMAFRSGNDPSFLHGVGMGLDSGELLFGSIGSKEMRRLDYTVIGETVHAAARLAALAESDQILIGEALHALVEPQFECRPVAGRAPPAAEARPVFEIVSRRGVQVTSTELTASLDASSGAHSASGPQATPLPIVLAASKRKESS